MIEFRSSLKKESGGKNMDTKLNSVILKYTCQLLSQRLDITYQAAMKCRKLTDQEQAQVDWIDYKMRMVEQLQVKRRPVLEGWD